MSEYQHIEFQAVDRALTDKELKFARRQSTRAEISSRSFRNEYNFGDFHGDVHGLLRNGYDIYLHYANFGIRTIAMRVPGRLPFARKMLANYLGDAGLSWSQDRGGDGGILTMDPYHEAGELDEIWDFESSMRAAVEIRRRLLGGDLRGLYVCWLAAVLDGENAPDDLREPPVPAGLAQLAATVADFFDFFGLDPLLLHAAAEACPDEVPEFGPDAQIREWVGEQSEQSLESLVVEFLTKEPAATQSATLAKILHRGGDTQWPTASSERTLKDLLDRTRELRQAANRKEQIKQQAAAKRRAAKEARQRALRIGQMSEAPDPWFRQVDDLVEQRGTDNYEAAAELLAELGEALAEEDGPRIVRKHAAHLAKQHPTLTRMKSSLRKRGLLD